MPLNHTCTRGGLNRRLLLIGATLVAGTALVSGLQTSTAQTDQSTNGEWSVPDVIVIEVQREPSATGYPRPFNYAD